MNFQQTKKGLIELGQSLKKWSLSDDSVIEEAYLYNNWFTKENIRMSLNNWSDQLIEEKLMHWMEKYVIGEHPAKRVAIIMAGNIPLVGFHDLVCVLLSGHYALVKMSSDDKILMKAVINELIRINPGFENRIELFEERIPKDFDAVIATGSNNTHRYFEYYFKSKPHLLRKNRSSVAVLTGNETPEDFQKLAVDIFSYFGLGCRNVSKVYVPESYDFTAMFDNLNAFSYVIDHNKYANNYTYHKSIFLMNLTKHLDNGFMMVKEDKAIASPLSALFFEFYSSKEALKKELELRKEEIQCIVGKINEYIPFGHSQFPEWSDYADGVDTMTFLLSI